MSREDGRGTAEGPTFCTDCNLLRCASTEDASCPKRKVAGGKHSWARPASPQPFAVGDHVLVRAIVVHALPNQPNGAAVRVRMAKTHRLVSCPEVIVPAEDVERASASPQPERDAVVADFVHEARAWLAENGVEQTTGNVTTLAWLLTETANKHRRPGSASADLEATAAEAERMRDESDERLRTTLLAIEHDIIAGGNLREILGRIERVVGKPGDPRRGDGLVTPCARPAEESELDSPPFKPLSLTELEARGFKRHGRTIMVGGFAPGNEAPNARAVELRETPSLHDASGHTGVYACSWCDAESKDVATVPHREGCQLAAIVARYLDLAGQSGSPDRGGSP